MRLSCCSASRRLLREGIVKTYDGKSLPMRPHSILLHGDTPGAVALARAVRREIETSGARVVPDIAPAGSDA